MSSVMCYQHQGKTSHSDDPVSLLSISDLEIYREMLKVPEALSAQAASLALFFCLLCYSDFSCLRLSGFGKEETVSVEESPNRVVWAQNTNSCLFAPNSRSLY